MELLNRLRPREGWLSLLLLWVVVWSFAHSVQEAEWVEDLHLVVPMGTLGIVVGLAATRSALRPVAAHVLSLILAAEMAVLMFSTRLSATMWEDRVNDVLYRVNLWLYTAMYGGNSRDNLMFGLVAAIFVWMLGYTMAWIIYRRGMGWLAFAIATISLLVHLSYSYASLNYHFYIMMFAGLLLLVRLELAKREAFWERAGLRVQGHVRRNVVIVSAISIVLVMWLAGRGPTNQPSEYLEPAWARISDTVQKGQSTFDRLFGGVQGPPVVVVGLAFSGTLQPREGFELGTAPVLRIEAPVARYWRTSTYEVYTGQGIASGEVFGDRVEADTPLPIPFGAREAREEFAQRVTILAPQSNLVFAADFPVLVSVPTLFEWRGDFNDPSALRLTNLIRRGQQYSVLSLVSVATEQQLRDAGTDYPAGMERYLALPPTLPERVKQLATEVTTEAPTAFDKAIAVEAYLRGLPYDTRVSPPPPDRDWVDYTLFDLRGGYSDYLSTTMMVMLRANGVPSRVVSGFAPGEFDPDEAAFVLYESEAHSWVEAFFPTYGWITFEPSVLRPAPSRPTTFEEAILLAGGGAQGPLEDFPDLFYDEFGEYFGGEFSPGLPERRDLPWIEALGYLGAIVAIAAAGFFGVRWAFRRGLSGLPWHAQWYLQLRRLGAWSGLSGRPSHTPHEYTTWLDDKLPGSGKVVRPIADCYVEGTYGGRAPDPDTLARAAAAWDEARGPLIRRVMLRGVIAAQEYGRRFWVQVRRYRTA
jgi:transglutaminase-like putative cysteine protease